MSNKLTGRPPLDRTPLLQLIRTHPRQGRYLVQLNERDAARKLGWSRATVGRALDQLEADGQVTRFRFAGRGGVLLRIADTSTFAAILN